MQTYKIAVAEPVHLRRGSIPGLKRHPHRHKAKLCLTMFHQQDVLVRPLGRLRRDSNAQRLAQDWRKPSTVDKIDPAG